VQYTKNAYVCWYAMRKIPSPVSVQLAQVCNEKPEAISQALPTEHNETSNETSLTPEADFTNIFNHEDD
jgi:hypothetical protein